MFVDGPIDGIVCKPLKRYRDDRGWLMELFREDDLDERYYPVMAYLSMTLPRVIRGPHEHRDQADLFCFVGPSNFKLFLWDNRPVSSTRFHRQTVIAGADNPQAVIVPVGVVHAYQNIGTEPGIVFNAPNRLYRGRGRQDEVDEIRHEQQNGSVFKLDW